MAELMTEEESSDLLFSFFYCMFSFWSSGLLVLVCVLSEGVSVFGHVLHSPQFLVVAALYEVGKVWLVKRLSGHGPSLLLPTAAPADNKPIRGPVLRKICVKLTRLWLRLTPLAHLAKGLILLLLTFLLSVYVTVCLGAPVTSLHGETAGFCVLATLLTTYPVLLALGPSTSSLEQVYSTPLDTSLASTLLLNSISTVAGAWLGAFPIPLDWDRAWQAWPITCCLGAVAGHVVGNLAGACRAWPKLAAMKNCHSKRKFV